MLVEDVMITDLATIDASASVHQAVGQMLKENVSYVVIVNDGTPAGVLTERKILQASYKTRRPLTKIPVKAFASGFDVKLQPEATVLLAVATMSKHDVDVLPIMDGIEIRGVVTKETILQNVSNIRKEAFDIRLSEDAQWKD